MPHSASLLRAARRLTFDTALAEDLAQETLLRAWRSFDQFEAGSNIRAWLFRILFNAYYAHGRWQGARPVLAFGGPAEPHGVLAAPDRSHTEGGRISDLDVASGFASLSEEHRVVLSLIVIEGFTCREASTILSLPMGTVMSRVARAREALRKRLVARSEPARAPVAATAFAGRQL
jgi:RNA polymerase sigma-70 factor, ECF subfamily